MFTYYFFLKNLKTKEEIIIANIDFLGEIGDKIIYNGKKYIVLDYAWEYE